MTNIEILERLAIALAVGLLVGAERGWTERSAEEGERIAGIRSFGLIGLLGALLALVHMGMDKTIIGLGFVGFAALVTVAYWLKAHRTHDFGFTTEVAALITFALGMATMQGHLSVVVGTAVVATTLLGLKPKLHDWLKKLAPNELHAALKLLLISVVLLPVLPNRGFGPWDALNPYEIWWMVVLIAAISFIGYFAIKIAGPRQGVMLTALTGGLASSTAATLNFARLAHNQPAMQNLLAAGIIAASATMFPRVLLIAGMLAPGLGLRLVWPLASMTVVGYGVAFWQWKTATGRIDMQKPPLRNPFEIKMALQFGALLTIIMLFAHALRQALGQTGIYLLAGVSGLADVDAITLSLSRLASLNLDPAVAATGIVIATMANTVFKAGLAIGVGRGAMKAPIGIGFAAIIVFGLAGLALGRLLPNIIQI